MQIYNMDHQGCRYTIWIIRDADIHYRSFGMLTYNTDKQKRKSSGKMLELPDSNIKTRWKKHLDLVMPERHGAVSGR